MDLSRENQETVWHYRGKGKEKYEEYLKKLNSGTGIEGKTIAKAIELLETSNIKRATQVADQLKNKRTIILFDELGGNRGWLYEKGEYDDQGLLNDGVIVIDKRFVDSYIGTAGVLSHELRHILDYEEVKSGRLSLDINDNPNGEANIRADIYSGYILNKIGFDKNFKHNHYFLSDEQKELIKERWGDKWIETSDDLNYKISQYNDFLTKKDTQYKLQRCGRKTKNFEEYGYCDRMIYFPPCSDH